MSWVFKGIRLGKCAKRKTQFLAPSSHFRRINLSLMSCSLPFRLNNTKFNLINYIYNLSKKATTYRSALARQYPNVFNGGEKKTSKFGWMGIMQKLPGDVFGPLEKRADEPLHNVLLHLEMAALDAVEMEKKFAKK